MARPPEADSAETHDRILAAAIAEVHASDPPTSLSMRKVAERAEVSLGTLQYYFPKKTDLFEGCLDEYHRRLSALGAQLIQEALAADPPRRGRALIEPAIREYFRFVSGEGALLHLRLIINTLEGELPPRRRAPMLGSLIGGAAEVVAPHVGIAVEEIPMTIQLLSQALTRFALMSDEERLVLSGSKDDRACEDFLVRAALRLLAMEDGDQ